MLQLKFISESSRISEYLTLVRVESALRTMFKALLVAAPPLLEMCSKNGTKITEWCQGGGH